MSNQLDAEIFAVGKWNGMTFTIDDLHNIASAFQSLQNNLKVPLKFGHNDEQPMTDGQPSLGWVDKVWVSGDKLMAHFVDMPKVVMDAIKKKLYKQVSVELDMDVSYKAQQYPMVLSGVALLGADIPAVSTLKDLTHYLSRSAAFSAGRKMMFSAIAGKTNKEKDMDKLEELTTKVAELTAKHAEFTIQNTELKTQNTALKAKVDELTSALAARDAADKKTRIDAKRSEVVAILEEGVKTSAITPAQREQFSKIARINDDAAIEALDIADVKALTAGGKQKFNREQGKEKSQGQTESVTAQVLAGCNEIISKGEAKDLFTAQSILFQRNPQLAREYVNFNEEV